MAGWQAAVAVVASVVGGAAILWPVLVELEVRKCERPKYSVVRALTATGATVAAGAAAKARSGGGGAVVEIRRYAPILMAEAPIDAESMKEAGSQGFRRLAGFIFGKNVAKGAEAAAAAAGGGAGGAGAAAEKVAMTSPVIMEMKDANEKVAMTSPVIMEMKDGAAGASGSGDNSGNTNTNTNNNRIRATMAFTMPSKYTKDTLPKPLDDQVKVRELPARTVATLQFRGQVRTEAAYERPAARLRAALQAAGIAIKGPLEVYQYYPPFTWSFLRINEVAYEVEEVGAAEGVAAVAASK